VKAAVLAIVLEALVKVSRRALKNAALVVIAVAAFVAIALFQLPFPIIILAAALIGGLLQMGRPPAAPTKEGSSDLAETALPEWAQPSMRRVASSVAVWCLVWLVPLFALYASLGANHVFAVEAGFFSKMAMVTFGGAYAVLAYVGQQAVEVHGWLQPGEMLAGLGLAETTPGPLILVLVFIGFLGGARQSGLDPLTGGLAGAVVTLWFTFVPCFLWIFAGAPYVETVRNVRWLASSLAAVTAAVVGIIANLSIWFALHVLFAKVGQWTIGPAAIPLPDLSTFDSIAAVIALASAVALLGFGVRVGLVIGLAAVAGMSFHAMS
jgi:chromate transporter